jgi:hypothetical protein
MLHQNQQTTFRRSPTLTASGDGNNFITIRPSTQYPESQISLKPSEAYPELEDTSLNEPLIQSNTTAQGKLDFACKPLCLYLFWNESC